MKAITDGWVRNNVFPVDVLAWDYDKNGNGRILVIDENIHLGDAFSPDLKKVRIIVEMEEGG